MEPRQLTGVITKGSPDGWVQLYEVEYKVEGEPWTKYVDKDNKPKQFSGNYDGTTPVTNEFDIPIRAQFIKIIPKTWQTTIVLSCEIIGCFKPIDIGIYNN